MEEMEECSERKGQRKEGEGWQGEGWQKEVENEVGEMLKSR